MLKKEQNKGWSIICMLIGIVMVFLGVMAIPKEGFFGVIWIILATGFAIVNAYNVFHKTGIGAFRLDLDINESDQEKNLKQK